MNAFILYGAYSNPYYRLVRVEDGKVWDRIAKVLSTSPTYSNSAITLGSKNSTIKGWPVVLAIELPNGVYDFQLYDAASPASSDVMVAGWRLIMPNKLLINPTEFPVDVCGRIRMTAL
jgi:hypothetical protein